MSTHDSYYLPDNTGALFRTDLNSYIAALRSLSADNTVSGPVAPEGGMFWVDTSASPVLLKLRDSTNSLWTTIYDVTNNKAMKAASVLDATTLSGYAVSTVADTPDTIYESNAVGIQGTVVGDASGIANTLENLTASEILDVSSSTFIPLVVSSGYYNFCSAGKAINSVTTGYETAISYDTNWSGTVRLIFSAYTFSGTMPVASYRVSQNGGVVGSTKNSQFTDTVWHDSLPKSLFHSVVLTVAEGDTIALEYSLTGSLSSFIHFDMRFCGNEYGHLMEGYP